MEAFQLAQLTADHERAGRLYYEFLRVSALSMGLYVLPAGESDPQQPHTEDEVYYVLGGRATFRAGDLEQPAEPGAVLFVEAGVEHRFHSIAEDLKLLVFFAPAQRRQPQRS